MPRNRSAITGVAAFASVLVASAAVAPAGGMVTLESKSGVRETMDALVQSLTSKGVNIAARIDHAASAKAFGMELPPTEVIIFGNPKLGTPLMQAAPSIALDLPLRIAVWQAADGKVMVGYTPPEELARRHGLTGQDEILATMSKVLDGLANAAAGVGK